MNNEADGTSPPEYSAIIAPCGLEAALIHQFREFISGQVLPGVRVSGPTPSGMARLRTGTGEILESAIVELRARAKEKQIDLCVLGRDPLLGPLRATAPKPAGMQAKSVDVDTSFGPEFESVEIIPAWSRTRGAPTVNIAVIDNGLRMSHPLIKGSLWSNDAERNGTTGHDDDGAGVVDDLHGADFSESLEAGVPYEDKPGEKHGHGTASGFLIAGAASRHETPYAGIAPDAKLIAVKFYDGDRFRDFELARAIEYAAVVGADIANVSYAHPVPLPATRRAIEFSALQGMLIVCSAGDDAGDLQNHKLWPAAFNFLPNAPENLVAVMSVTPSLNPLQSFSGIAVDIAAPDLARVAQSEGDEAGTAGDSSISAPYVSGVAALVKSLDTGFWSFKKIRKHIMESGIRHAKLAGKNRSAAVVNAKNAVLGPIQIIGMPEAPTWQSSSPPLVRWTLRYESSYCGDIVAEYLPSNTDTWQMVGAGHANTGELALDLNGLGGTRGEFRLRSLGSNFHTPVSDVTIA